jgi:thiamine transport system ATP-binding protein
MADPMLEVANVTVGYGGSVAVAEVSLRVPSGRRLALLGPSGCGKTSLLRAIAGLEPLVAGSVRIAGRDMAGVPTHRRGVGMMLQGHALFPHLDVAGNVAFGLRMARQPREASGARVAEMLALVGLADRGHSRITELSGGEQQRVALARTLAPAPAVVLLDEPLSSLDRALREELLGTMAGAFTSTGTTAVLVTHDQSEALQFGDRVAVMRSGRIVREGPPQDVWREPGLAWTARFLGLANVIGPDHPAAPTAAAGSWLVRPDLVRLDVGEAAGKAIPGRVAAVAFRGGLTVVTAHLDAGGSLAVWTMGTAPPVGSRVQVHVPAAAVQPLAGEAGRA